jgi:hypothetical protein
MDWNQIERQLERSFTSIPLEYGTARVVERDEPYELAAWILPRPEPTSYRDVASRHGNVVYALEQVGIETRRLLELVWDGFGPVSFGAGLDLVGSGPQRYLCWWDEDESYRAVAAIFPWWDCVAISRTISRVLSQVGEGFGLELFRRLPDEMTNRSPDLVLGDVLKPAFSGAMQVLQYERGDAWLSLAEEHFGRVVEPDHLQRCLDVMQYVFDGQRPSLDDGVDQRIAESSAMPTQARRRLLDEWFAATYRSVGAESAHVSRGTDRGDSPA